VNYIILFQTYEYKISDFQVSPRLVEKLS